MCSLHMLETLCVMKESILYNNIFNLKTDVHNTKYLTCTYKMCPRERDGVNLHSLIPTQVFSIAFESMSLTPKQLGDISI